MADDGTGRRRALAVAVVVAMGWALVACSSGDSGDSGGSDDSGGSGDAGGAGDTTGAEPGGGAGELPERWAGYHSDAYASDERWLCRAGMAGDVCTGEDLTATSVGAGGTTEVQAHEAAAEPPVDCFYVYPTASRDEGLNADLEPHADEEVWTARNQAARLTAACRVFAPTYRQATVGVVGGAGTEDERAAAFRRAYDDVVDAFKHYLANDSDGRGVVLVGHSQGAGLLRDMLATEVEPEPAVRERVVSALLVGTTVAVPEGEVVGATFAEFPLCAAEDEVGCVVSYATFAAGEPPPADSRFGRTDEPGTEAACVNPAAPGGGPAMLRPYFPTRIPEGTISAATADPATVDRLGRLATPWVLLPDYVRAECVRRDGAGYLEATIGGPGDERGDSVGGSLGPDWGLHLVDVNIAMGDIVGLVATQGAAYAEG